MLFTRSEINTLRDAATAAHRAWHAFSLQVGRKKSWCEKDGESLAEVRASIAAVEASPSDPETGELPDSTALRNEEARLLNRQARHLQEYQTAMQELAVLEAAKDKAAVAVAEKTFDIEHLEPVAKLFLEFHRRHQAMAEAQTKLPSHPQFAIPAINDDLITAWMREKDARCNPPVRSEPDWTGMILFTRDWSPGQLSGKRYSIGDGAYFEPKLAAEIVAGGFARYQRPNDETEKLVKAANHRLASIDRKAGILTSEMGGNVSV